MSEVWVLLSILAVLMAIFFAGFLAANWRDDKRSLRDQLEVTDLSFYRNCKEYEEGAKAFFAGIPLSDDPYVGEPLKPWAWSFGWHDACQFEVMGRRLPVSQRNRERWFRERCGITPTTSVVGVRQTET